MSEKQQISLPDCFIVAPPRKTYIFYIFAICVKDWTNIINIIKTGASEFFLGFICNCLSYTTAKISFNSILYPQFTHMIFIIYIAHNQNTSNESY